MSDTSLHSLHASPVTNVAELTVTPSSEREVVVEFAGSPDAGLYLDAVADSIEALARSSAALVVSLGYDIVAGDPHGPGASRRRSSPRSAACWRRRGGRSA